MVYYVSLGLIRQILGQNQGERGRCRVCARKGLGEVGEIEDWRQRSDVWTPGPAMAAREG
jgi:hypothetical protein